MKFKIKDIRPNPFRDIARYPTKRDKIDALRASINQTGFWDNIVARLGQDGLPQIAYGHHRLEALRLEYPDGEHEVGLIIRDLNDETMLKIMAQENMGEWGSTFEVTVETIRAVILAYAEDKITLPAMHPQTDPNDVRYAPDFVKGVPPVDGPVRPYTAHTVAEFLGWLCPGGRTPLKIRDAIMALRFEADGIIAPATFDNLSATAAHARIALVGREIHAREKAAERAAAEAEIARREAEEARAEAARKRASAKAAIEAANKADEAERAAKVAAKTLEQASQEALKTAAEAAIEAAERKADDDQAAADAAVIRMPESAGKDYNALAEQTSRMLTAYLDIPTGVGPRIEELIRHRDDLHQIPRETLAEAARQLASRLIDASARLLENWEPLAAVA